KKCLAKAPEQVTVDGVAFERDSVTAADRILYYWLPASLGPQKEEMQRIVGQRLADKMRPLGPVRLKPADFVAALLAKKLLVLESKKMTAKVVKRMGPFLRWQPGVRASVILEILSDTEGVEEVLASEDDVEAILNEGAASGPKPQPTASALSAHEAKS